MRLDLDLFGHQSDVVPYFGTYMRLYHNPRCSKSRQALNLLNEMNIQFQEYRYLDEGIHPDDLEIILKLTDVIRTNDLEKGIEIDLSDYQQISQVVTSNPRVLQRPILIVDGKAVIGRPPEKILTLLPSV